MKEIKGDVDLALRNLIQRLQLPEFDKSQILSKWDAERGNDWFTGTLLKEYKSKELKGVKLYRAMYERGDRYINCFVSNDSEERAEIEENPRCVIGALNRSNGAEVFFCGWDREGFQEVWNYVVPINSKGEILTQEEAGL